MKKIIAITLLLVVIIVVLAAAIFRPTIRSVARPLSARVVRGDVVRSIRLSGRVKPLRTVAVKATVSGVLRNYLVAPGDPVHAGQPIALIDPDPTLARDLEGGRITVSDTFAELEFRHREAERTEALYRSGLIPKRDWEIARDAHKIAADHAALSKRQLAILERQAHQVSGHRQADFRLLSPIDGTLLSGNLEVGETLIAGINGFSQGGTVVAKVADLSRFTVRLDVGEADILDVRTGMKVEIIPSGNRRLKYSGVVTSKSLDGTSAQATTTYAVDVLVEPGARLIPEMSCDVNLIVDERHNVVALPNLSLVKTATGTYVRRLGHENKQQLVRITVGLSGDDRSEILSGIAPGDVVAIVPGVPAPAEQR
ncbi:MAG: efflux RND transporter periplasmic adaptor subunit [Thermoanaerobaculia bacterium]